MLDLADDNLITRAEARNGKEHMTTKAKPRTAPAAGDRFHRRMYVSDLHKAIARLHFLEADSRYHAALSTPGARSAVLKTEHWEERAEIMQRLSKTVPDHFDDAMELLDFATKRLNSIDDIDFAKTMLIGMLKNARAAAYKANLNMEVDFALRRFNETRIEYDAF